MTSIKWSPRPPSLFYLSRFGCAKGGANPTQQINKAKRKATKVGCGRITKKMKGTPFAAFAAHIQALNQAIMNGECSEEEAFQEAFKSTPFS